MRVLTAVALAMLTMSPAAHAMSVQNGMSSGNPAITPATTPASAAQAKRAVTIRGTIETLDATHREITLYHQPVHYSGSSTQVFKDDRRVDTGTLAVGQHIRALVRKVNGVNEAEIIWINPR